MAIDKNKVHSTCLVKQQEELDSFIQRVKSLKEDINSKDHSSSQKEERTAGKVDMLRNFEKELTFSQMEMHSLQSLDPTQVSTKVEAGALVMTNSLNFYISIPIDKIEIDDKTIIGISVKAPIYAEMRDKVKGDTFSFNDTAYEIIDLQ